MQNSRGGCRDSRGPAPSALRAKAQRSRSGPRCSSIRSAPKRSWPGRHRRVRGEDHFARDARHGLVEAEPFVLHAAANGFQHRESAVPFVHVQHAGRDPMALSSARSRPRPAAAPGGCARARRRRKAATSARGPPARCPPRWNRAAADRSGPLSCARLWRGSIRRAFRSAPVTGSPFLPMAGSMGSWLTSVWRYSSCCQPCESSRWRKYPWP
jgi:hypothetical protein